jgi:hypothetical protein
MAIHILVCQAGMPVLSRTVAQRATAASNGERMGREPVRALKKNHGGEGIEHVVVGRPAVQTLVLIVIGQ